MLLLNHLIYNFPTIEYFHEDIIKNGIFYKNVGANNFNLTLYIKNIKKGYLGQFSDNQFIYFDEKDQYEFLDAHGVMRVFKEWEIRVSKHEKFT